MASLILEDGAVFLLVFFACYGVQAWFKDLEAWRRRKLKG